MIILFLNFVLLKNMCCFVSVRCVQDPGHGDDEEDQSLRDR